MSKDDELPIVVDGPALEGPMDFPWARMAEVVSEEVDESLAAALELDDFLRVGLDDMRGYGGPTVMCPHCGGLVPVDGGGDGLKHANEYSRDEEESSDAGGCGVFEQGDFGDSGFGCKGSGVPVFEGDSGESGGDG